MRSITGAITLYLYGFWIAFTYQTFVALVPNTLVATFAVGALIAGLISSLLLRRVLAITIRDPFSWIRGICFGLTQFFIFRALKSGDTAAAFCASSAALLAVLPFAKLILKEKVGLEEWIGASISIGGVFLLSPRLDLTRDATISGVFQALSIIVARHAGLRNQSVLGNTIHGLLVGSCMCLPLCFEDVSLVLVRPTILTICALLIMSTQLYFLFISFKFDPVSVSQVSQSRIAWAILINATMLRQFPELKTIAGAGMVLCPAMWIASRARYLPTFAEQN